MATRQVGARAGAPATLPVGARVQTVRRGPYKAGYTDEDIKNARIMHEQHGWSQRKAADQYNIPRTTFMDYLKGNSLMLLKFEYQMKKNPHTL